MKNIFKRKDKSNPSSPIDRHAPSPFASPTTAKAPPLNTAVPGQEAVGGSFLPPPTPTIWRSDTTTHEEIFAPSFGDENANQPQSTKPEKKRLSQILGLKPHTHRRRSSESGQSGSVNVPTDLEAVDDNAIGDNKEAMWEKRASQLAGVQSPTGGSINDEALGNGNGAGMMRRPSPSPSGGRSRSPSTTTRGTDADIQEAIRLHESGDLANSAKIFKRLADPNGANNPLSQVLYGLALRHSWGVERDEKEAVKYLRSAAANSAEIEQAALRAGMKKGGAAKGELVLAIFELGNCYRYKYGVEEDPFAAFNYYLTAANLGDTDAMNETAWCYLEGYGVKKDKFNSAKYYRMAEKAGNKTLGNSWIWKEKYDHPPSPKADKRRSFSPRAFSSS